MKAVSQTNRSYTPALGIAQRYPRVEPSDARRLRTLEVGGSVLWGSISFLTTGMSGPLYPRYLATLLPVGPRFGQNCCGGIASVARIPNKRCGCSRRPTQSPCETMCRPCGIPIHHWNFRCDLQVTRALNLNHMPYLLEMQIEPAFSLADLPCDFNINDHTVVRIDQVRRRISEFEMQQIKNSFSTKLTRDGQNM